MLRLSHWVTVRCTAVAHDCGFGGYVPIVYIVTEMVTMYVTYASSRLLASTLPCLVFMHEHCPFYLIHGMEVLPT